MARISNLAELKARGELRKGDEVVFAAKGETLTYSVGERYLRCATRVRGANGWIFEAIGLEQESEEKTRFVKAAQGYELDHCDFWPEFRNGDFAAATRLVEAIYIEIARQEMNLPAAKAQEPQKADTPDGPRVIATVEELRAAPLQAGDKFTIKGRTLEVRSDDDGFYGYYVGDYEAKVFRDLGIEDAEEYIEGIVGYEPGSFLWPEVRTAEDLAKVIEDLMIRAGQGEAPYREGDTLRNSHGRYRRILDVLDGGKQFFLSNNWSTVGALDRDPAPRILGVRVALEELKRDYTRVVAPESQAPVEQEDTGYAEGDLIHNPEDGDFARILLASKSGELFFLSDWTDDRTDEEALSNHEDGALWTLEEIKEHNLVRIAPTPTKPAPITLTRLQIAEKFGVTVEQLQIEDEAA